MEAYGDFDWTGMMNKIPWENNEAARKKRKEMWRAIDMNGNGYCSLAELDRGIRDVLNLPTVFDAKRPIMRAFQAAKTACKAKSTHSDDYVEWLEFRYFLVFLRQYFEYWV
ncbi:MAG: hypothetical protein MJ252_29940, partial [archaeon]|nr:hypothetical protein [archaeon]